MMDGIAVQADGLKKTYRSGGKQTQALLGVDLQVKRGEIVCLLGPYYMVPSCSEDIHRLKWVSSLFVSFL